MGEYPGLSRWVQCYHKGHYKRKRETGDSEPEKVALAMGRGYVQNWGGKLHSSPSGWPHSLLLMAGMHGSHPKPAAGKYTAPALSKIQLSYSYSLWSHCYRVLKFGEDL